jgi:hypothetical protein
MNPARSGGVGRVVGAERMADIPSTVSIHADFEFATVAIRITYKLPISAEFNNLN